MSFFYLIESAYGADSYVPHALQVRSEASSQLSRINPSIHSARLPGTDAHLRFDVSRTYVNYWAYDTRYKIDAEVTDDQFHMSYKVSPFYRLGLGMNQRAFSNSGTDGMAIGFHKLFGMPQDGRLNAKRNDTRYSVPAFNLEYTAKHKDVAFSRQTELETMVDLGLIFDLPFAVTFVGMAAYESAEANPFFSQAFDKALQLNVAFPFNRWALYASLNHLIFDNKRELDIQTYKQQWGWTGGLAYLVAQGHEVLTQFMVNQSIFQDMGQLSRNSYELHAAYRYQFEDFALEATLIENIFWIYNTPDWGYTVGVRYNPDHNSKIR